MEIHQVKEQLVLTSRLDDLGHFPIKVLQSTSGVTFAAVDPIGVKAGDWVFTIANSAARLATGNVKTVTDLTVAGIIDNWQP
ncbi:carboxysome peptide B [Candidatus Thioglobus sp.]|uniref:carboxysome peptide B n=1 Tax=Candidatus Thioglobus sp. TaxID=2026721 RepID=UPI003D10B29D